MHIKSKHPVEKEKEAPKPKVAKSQPRNRVLEMQQNEHEDTIYAYLGELGEKNQENGSRDEILAEENQKQIIQTNYSFNKVVRTPYEKEISPPEHIPSAYIEESPDKEFLQTLSREVKEFHEKLEAEKEKW